MTYVEDYSSNVMTYVMALLYYVIKISDLSRLISRAENVFSALMRLKFKALRFSD